MARDSRFHLCFVAPAVVTALAALVACGGRAQQEPQNGTPGPESATPAITASKQSDALKGAMLDPKNVPDLAKLDHAGLKAVMHSFADSLGVMCTECHATKADGSTGGTMPTMPSPAMSPTATRLDGGTADAGRATMPMGPQLDFEAWTPNKRIASKMWSEFVQKLEFANGDPLYCDSCHQGKNKFLDRSNEAALKDWMHDNFVDKLVRKDGQPMSCANCHGMPFDGHFLHDRWATGP
jgi:hypothetical protein